MTITKTESKSAIIAAKKTRADLSFLVMTPISPVIKEENPQIMMSKPVIQNGRLSKNVSPRSCPEILSIWNTTINKIEATISHTDHLPKEVLGRK